MIAMWYFGSGKYDGQEKVKGLKQFEVSHSLAVRTYRGKKGEKLVAVYTCSDGSTARIMVKER